ncbi:multidrug ABC transporter [Komagataeibacter diospyri]|uniref:MFS transporter n=1 Tax=Komagataeibacter diospyri TaxID=1932662 RepID=UPI001136AFDA|nr:MFS transporter [Komagataeibacter diospyri]GCE90375.1 multidrug ABC transporter [Komagataeibacter diospyri]
MDGTTVSPVVQSNDWKLLFSGQNGIRTLVLAGGVALHAINLYMILAVLPSAVRDIGGMRYYAWNETLFIAASIVGSSLSISLLASLGPRRAYGTAATIFAAGALLCALAPSMIVMLGGRIFQGIGAGMLVSLAYAVIRLIFPEQLWTRAMGMLSSMWGMATLIGPAIGGLFAQAGEWRLSFWFMCASAGLFALLAVRVLPDRFADDSKGQSSVAWRQLMLLVLSVLVLSIGSAMPHLIENVLGLALAACLFVLFIRCEQRNTSRLLPMGTLHLRSPLLPLYGLLGGLALTVEVIEIFAPLFLQTLHHQGPLVAGYLSALMAAGWSVGSFAGAGASGGNARRLLAAAPVLGLAAIVFLAWWMPHDVHGGIANILPIALAFILVGTGVGMAWPHLLSGILRATPQSEQGVASASLTTMQLYTTAVAAAVAGTIANAAGLVSPGGTAGIQHAAFWVFAVFSVIPCGCVFLSRQVLVGHRNYREV